jgi:hypothetical protein
MQRIIMAVTFLATIVLFGCGGGSGQSGERGREGDVLPAHERELQALPQYPGSAHYGTDVSTGGGTYARFSVPASPGLTVSFYEQQIPLVGWKAASGPTALPQKAAEEQQIAQTFTKGKLTLTVYVTNNNAPVSEATENILVVFFLQEQ